MTTTTFLPSVATATTTGSHYAVVGEPWDKRLATVSAEDIAVFDLVGTLGDIETLFETQPGRQEDGGVTREFAELTATWKRETRIVSNPNVIAMHPAYQRIVGMGWSALPHILRDLRDTRAWWFWALWAITGVQPYRDEDRGDVEAMARSWLGWGAERGLI